VATRGRTVSVSCSAAQAKQLAQALRAYVDAAYPPGGSECTQVARETLLDTAVSCAAHPGGALQLRKRQVPQIKAAIQWSLNENPSTLVESLRGLQKRLAAR
jgi:hypothetical protein